jgi:hypothetical protein
LDTKAVAKLQFILKKITWALISEVCKLIAQILLVNWSIIIFKRSNDFFENTLVLLVFSYKAFSVER